MMKTDLNKCVSTAKVGRDTFEDAEYFIHEYSKFEKENTFKNWLESLCDAITIPYWRIRRKIIDAYWEIRYGFQRMFKGYDSVDTFETYQKFIDRYSKILIEYRKYHIGHVGTMTEEEWNNVIDEMIYHLHYMDENNVNKELQKDVPENWFPTLATTYKIMHKHSGKFFELFSKYFYDLWD